LRVAFLSRAGEELVEAVVYYDAQRSGLGAALVDDVDRATELITSFPSLGTPAPGGARRVHLRRFPFSVVYTRTPEAIWIVAVEHHRQRPGAWSDRVR